MEFHGKHYDIPYTGAGNTGFGKPLKSIVHPLRSEIPIYLGAEGPKNVAMAAEIADGWMPIFFSPKSDAFYREGAGRRLRAAGRAAHARMTSRWRAASRSS